jgi:hypothetical protein
MLAHCHRGVLSMRTILIFYCCSHVEKHCLYLDAGCRRPAFYHQHVFGGTSQCLRVLCWNEVIPSASFFRPLDWVREKLATGVKENQSEEEIQAAREQAKKQGVSNLFEGASAAKPKAEALITSREMGRKKGPSKPKPSSVCCIRHTLLCSFWISRCSTNIRQPTSRFLIAN